MAGFRTERDPDFLRTDGQSRDDLLRQSEERRSNPASVARKEKRDAASVTRKAMIEGVAPGSLFLNLQMLFAQRAQPLVGTGIATVSISNCAGLHAEVLF